MKGAFVILLFTIAVGIVLYIMELRWRHRHPSPMNDAIEKDELSSAEGTTKEQPTEDGPDENSGECCGLHLVCEKESLSPMSADIEYYDDEELNRFRGRDPKSYTPEEEEEFRDVLMTLRPEDVAGWARSITARRLELPPDVREELLMMVREQRGK